MDNEKRITFTAEDKGVGSMFEKLRGQANQYYQEYFRNARQESTVFKDQVSFINEKIKALERENELARRSALIESRERYQQEYSTASTAGARKRAESRYEEAKMDIASAFEDEKATISLLRQILEESRTQNKLQERRAQQEEERWDNKKSLWDQELKEDPEGVRARIREAKKRNYEGLSPETRDKLQYHEMVIGNEPLPARQRSFLRDLIQTALLQQTFQAIRQTITSIPNARDENALTPELYGAGIRLAGYGAAGITNLSGTALLKAGGKLAGKGALDAAGLEGVVSMIAQAEIAVAEIAGSVVQSSIQRHLGAKREKDIANLSMRSMTGRGSFSATEYGMTTAQIAEIAKIVAVTNGTAIGVEGRTKNMLGLEFGFGVNRNSIMQSMGIGRMTGVEGTQMIANLISTLKDKGIIKGNDFSKLGENIEVLNSFLQNQSQSLLNPNVSSATGMIAAFRQLGGPFADQRLGGLLNQFNQSLVNPGNDFDKARNFAVISTLRGGQGSYFDILKDEAKGLSLPGFFGQTLKQIEAMSGGGLQNTSLGIMSRFSFLSPEQAELLASMFMSDRTRFDNFSGSEEDIQSLLSGRPKAASIVQGQAQIEEAFSESGLEGFKTALKLNIGKFKDQLTQDILDAVFEGLGVKTSKTTPKTNPIPLPKATKQALGVSESGHVYVDQGNKY